MSNQKVVLTKAGELELKSKIAKLQIKLREMSDSLNRAVENYGVFDEQYSDRLERKQFIQRDLEELNEILANSVVVDGTASKTTQKTPEKKVDIGDIVWVSQNKVKHQYQIVSAVEANPVQHKISAESPVGASLVGKSVGEQVKITLPFGDVVVRITDIQ